MSNTAHKKAIEFGEKKNVLILEDDSSLSKIICKSFTETSLFNTFQAFSISDSKRIVKKICIDLISLDLALPDGNGLEFLVDLLDSKIQVVPKVIVLSKKTDIKYRTGSFELGADDYMPKPFNPQELVCRAKKLLGLNGFRKPEESLVYNDWIKINKRRKELWVDDSFVRLSRNEYILLEILMNSYGYISKEELKMKFERKTGSSLKENALRTAINRLRAKLYRTFHMRLIKTRYGMGYYIGPERKRRVKA